MLTQGYAATSLTGLAKAAGISVSHLYYYYSDKDAILEDLCEEVLSGLLAATISYSDNPPDERLHALVNQVFFSDVVTKSERVILLELNVLAIHRPKIRKQLSQLGHDVRVYVVDLFSKVPRQRGLSAEDAADIALAIWGGMFTNSFNEEHLNDGRARRLVRRTLFSLANIPEKS